ncbi:MAG: recombinase family protein [Phenylobacterium sp.]|nr:recombinase family protein [Phenylobacterium sp.]
MPMAYYPSAFLQGTSRCSYHSVYRLQARLEEEGIRSKVTRSRRGHMRGGNSFSSGALFHMIRSRIYLGEIPHGAMSYPGAHPAIIDTDLFDRVQAMLATHRRERKERPVRAASMPLRGLVFDTDGDPMSPSFTYGRKGKVYRYYVSAPMQQGRSVRSDPNALRRVTADEIEGVLERELRRRLGRPDDAGLRDMIGCVTRVDLEAQAVRISVLRAQVSRDAVVDIEPDPRDPNVMIVTLPIRCKFRSGRTWITGANDRAMRMRRDPMLINSCSRRTASWPI